MLACAFKVKITHFYFGNKFVQFQNCVPSSVRIWSLTFDRLTLEGNDQTPLLWLVVELVIAFMAQKRTDGRTCKTCNAAHWDGRIISEAQRTQHSRRIDNFFAGNMNTMDNTVFIQKLQTHITAEAHMHCYHRSDDDQQIRRPAVCSENFTTCSEIYSSKTRIFKRYFTRIFCF